MTGSLSQMDCVWLVGLGFGFFVCSFVPCSPRSNWLPALILAAHGPSSAMILQAASQQLGMTILRPNPRVAESQALETQYNSVVRSPPGASDAALWLLNCPTPPPPTHLVFLHLSTLQRFCCSLRDGRFQPQQH